MLRLKLAAAAVRAPGKPLQERLRDAVVYQLQPLRQEDFPSGMLRVLFSSLRVYIDQAGTKRGQFADDQAEKIANAIVHLHDMAKRWPD